MKKSLNILDRDRTGTCFGECKDLILEGMKNRQKEILADPFKSPDSFPSVPWAKTRNDQPGWLGGHV
ncbi:MAG: hypothetical protein KKD44_18140 [Proteobacteria bacterium]|nr:hypothetical protein [Pseudomonadota bacterium]